MLILVNISYPLFGYRLILSLAEVIGEGGVLFRGLAADAQRAGQFS
jgi:hypothetical protein